MVSLNGCGEQEAASTSFAVIEHPHGAGCVTEAKENYAGSDKPHPTAI
jgi:hypothetical protein